MCQVRLGSLGLKSQHPEKLLTRRFGMLHHRAARLWKYGGRSKQQWLALLLIALLMLSRRTPSTGKLPKRDR